MGKLLILAGVLLVVVGLLLSVAPGMFGWFGHLPGDLRLERRGVTIFLPITSCLVLSMILSLVLHLINKLA